LGEALSIPPAKTCHQLKKLPLGAEGNLIAHPLKKISMNKYICLALLPLLVFSCSKQPGQSGLSALNDEAAYLSNVKAYLRTNLSDSDFMKVDFNDAVLSKQGTSWLLRIALFNIKLSEDFVLLKTDSTGHCSAGKFIRVRRDSSEMRTFNGKISIESFNHAAVVKNFVAGVPTSVKTFGATEQSVDDASGAVIPACGDCLPEVIVVGYLPSGTNGGISYGEYFNLLSLLSGSDPVGSAGAASPITGGGGSGTGSNASSRGIYSPIQVQAGPATVKRSADIIINYETIVPKPGINVSDYMKCFSLVPDAGSECSVTIFVDLPVDDDPSYIFNALTGATGHCFLQLTKTNAFQSVTQYIGFSASQPVAILGATVTGKIVDNALHKYNAALTMSITPAALQTEINAVGAIGNNPSYNIWNYNCVNYALNVLNQIRPLNPLKAVPLDDPSSPLPYSTPQGLYLALGQLRQQNGPDAPHINLGLIEKVNASHGPCN
jgi:hypothetical protein